MEGLFGSALSPSLVDCYKHLWVFADLWPAGANGLPSSALRACTASILARSQRP